MNNIEDIKESLINEVVASINAKFAEIRDYYNSMPKTKQEAVILAAQKVYSLHFKEMVKPCRAKKYNEMRTMVANALRVYCNCNYTQIGIMLNRSHTTVLHMISNHNTWYEWDTKYKNTYDALTKDIDFFNKTIMYSL